ncbi:MAG: response regulator [Bacteroidales bacterium]|nr:response regulator [Bacteroidales bacterium]MBN2750446.1 response regulator [Bacteroidales bacterium]
MKLANQVLKFCCFRGDFTDKEKLVKLVMLNLMNITMFVFFVSQAIILVINSESLAVAVAYFASAIFLLASYFLASMQKQTAGFSFASIVIVALMLLGGLTVGSVGGFGALMLGLFPIFIIGILGMGTGSLLFIVGFLLLASMLLFIPLEPLINFNTPLSSKLIFVLTYAIAAFVAIIIESLRQRILSEVERKMLDQKNSNRLKEEFIAKLSHQIRTPLNNIMVIANILSNSELDDKQRDMIDTIHASTNNLVNVVNSMVEISNVDLRESGSYSINFNLNSTIQSTLKLFTAQNSNTVAFSLRIDESIPKTLNGDPVKIKQIFLNLVENILKNKSSNKTAIEIKVTKTKESADNIELYFEIRSNRAILLPVDQEHNQFITNETTYSSASTQIYIELLELNITQKLIESNGGKLSINLSQDNALFSFPFTLKKVYSSIAEPVSGPTNEDKEQQSSQVKTERGKPASTINLENANVLLVEDNLINQKIVVLSLKKIVKNIEIANNGKEALDKFGTSKYDIILMDIQMPIMNGIVTTKKIREIESSTNSHTPIIAITANALLGDREECLAAGMDDYISKPFQIEVLIQKMRNLLKINEN